MDLPPLSESERAGLVESIRQDGVKYPVLLDSAGEVIDGHNRRAIAAELGVACPTLTLDVDAAAAARLRISLNVDRRQLDKSYRKQLVTELRSLGMSTRDIADTVGVGKSTVERDLSTVPRGTVDDFPVAITGRDGKKRPRSRSDSTARRYEIAARKQADTDRAAEHRRSERATRDANAERQTAAMARAPAGALNLPALRKARQARSVLIEIATTIPSERFVSQLPIEACREFTADIVAWWLKVALLADDRLAVGRVLLDVDLLASPPPAEAATLAETVEQIVMAELPRPT